MIQSTVANEFKEVLSADIGRRRAMDFLTHIFHLFPEKIFYALIEECTNTTLTESECYTAIQSRLKEIKSFLAELTYSLPSLSKQKKEMLRQTLAIPGFPSTIDGYVEIGSPGRYISVLQKARKVSGDIVLVNETPPSMSLVDIAERGGLARIGRWIPLNYTSGLLDGVADSSVDVVTCYIGLHHAPESELPAVLASIRASLHKGGLFIMRDHDVRTMDMATFVSWAHTVFNIGTAVPETVNAADTKLFRSADEWSHLICSHGFSDVGVRSLQDSDPTLNTLLAFKAV